MIIGLNTKTLLLSLVLFLLPLLKANYDSEDGTIILPHIVHTCWCIFQIVFCVWVSEKHHDKPIILLLLSVANLVFNLYTVIDFFMSYFFNSLLFSGMRFPVLDSYFFAWWISMDIIKIYCCISGYIKLRKSGRD